MVWGGSGIEKVVYDFIRSSVHDGGVIVELGAGHVSTKMLCENYYLYSVEHNKEFLNLYKSNYIYAPIKDGWYDIEILKDELPGIHFQDLILIDGYDRKQILEHLYLFNPEAMYIIHDTYRDEEKQLAIDLGKALKREAVFHTDGDYWATI